MLRQPNLSVVHSIVAGLGFLIAANNLADAASVRSEQAVVSRPVGEPIMAIVSLRSQHITIYDDQGWIMRAPVSSGMRGRETPAGIFTVLQKDAEHYSNMYDDAYMPHMQRLTWSGIALHGGALPGYAASHGCIRMPYDFAGRFFDETKLGMRVIVAPGEVAPVPFDPPALLRPKTSTVAAVARAAAVAERAATAKAEKARLVSMTAYREWVSAMVPVRKAETLRLKADWELTMAERTLTAATSSDAKQRGEDAKAKAAAKIDEIKAQLAVGKAELQPKLATLTAAREAALSAERAREIAADAARKAARELKPISVFISRKTQRLYVRQALQPILEVPIAIRDPDRSIGTYVFTELETGNDIRWNVVSLAEGRGGNKQVATTAPEAAKAALERITIPQYTLDFITERLWPRSTLIVSDEALSPETGQATEFVVTLSTEPQGGLKHRRPAPRAETGFGQRPVPF